MFWPYLRDPETLARPWALPGTAGPRAPHRRPGEGRRQRATCPTTASTTSAWSACGPDKIAGIAADIPPAEVDDEAGRRASCSLVGWGSTYGAIAAGGASGCGPAA